MEKHVIVCGWSRISKVCIPELLAAGRAVSVVCEEEHQINRRTEFKVTSYELIEEAEDSQTEERFFIN